MMFPKAENEFYVPIVGAALVDSCLGADLIAAELAADSKTISAVLRGLWIDQLIAHVLKPQPFQNTLASRLLCRA